MVFDIYNSNVGTYGPLHVNARGVFFSSPDNDTEITPVHADGGRSIAFKRDVSVPRLLARSGIDVLKCLQVGEAVLGFVHPLRKAVFYDNVIVVLFTDGFLPPAPSDYTSPPFDFTSLQVTATKPGQPTEVLTWANGIKQSETDAYFPFGPENRLTRIRVTVNDAHLAFHPTDENLRFKQGYTYTLTWGADAVPGYFGDQENDGSDTSTVATQREGEPLGLNMEVVNFTTQHSAVQATIPSIPGIAYARFMSTGVFIEYQPGTISSGEIDFSKFTVTKTVTATGAVSDTFTVANGKITTAVHRLPQDDFVLIYQGGHADGFTYTVTWTAGAVGGEGWFSGSANDGSETIGSTTEHLLPPNAHVPPAEVSGVTKVTFNGRTVANSRLEFKAPHGT
jgi:hypothetical protein